jgi:hypothetical protein
VHTGLKFHCVQYLVEEYNFWEEEDDYPFPLRDFSPAMPPDRILCKSSSEAAQKGGVDEAVALSLFSLVFWSLFLGFGGFVL